MECMETNQAVLNKLNDVLVVNCPKCRNENKIQLSLQNTPMECVCGYRVSFTDDQINETRKSLEELKRTLGLFTS